MKSSLPLSGREILVTREAKAAEGMADIIRDRGGIPRVVPLIAFRPFKDPEELTYLENLSSYEWIFFTSKNGVNFFFEKLKEYNISLEDYSGKFAAVGRKTCLTLESFGLQADFVPENFTAADFAEEFLEKINTASSVLISKGNLAKDTISAFLFDRDIACDEWITYETYFPIDHETRLIKLLKKKELTALTFTSSSTIKRFMKIVMDNHLLESVKELTVACIGPVTKKTAEGYGLTVDVMPVRYTVEDMIENLSEYFASQKLE